MATRKYDIRQLINKIDPSNTKTKNTVLAYEFSNGRKFYKNEFKASVNNPAPPPATNTAFLTINYNSFVTSDGLTFRVQN